MCLSAWNLKQGSQPASGRQNVLSIRPRHCTGSLNCQEHTQPSIILVGVSAMNLPPSRALLHYNRVLTPLACTDLLRKLGRESLELVLLGTGAAMPSKYRNVTATYLDFFDKGGMLVDCGEGTYGQLLRKYGPKANEIIRTLRLVWISHIHADHHVGLSRYVLEYSLQINRSILVQKVVAYRRCALAFC